MYENDLSKQYNDTGRFQTSAILKQSKPNKTELKWNIIGEFTYILAMEHRKWRKIIYCLLSSTTSKTHGCLYGLTHLQPSLRAPHFTCAMHVSMLVCQKLSHESFYLFYMVKNVVNFTLKS